MSSVSHAQSPTQVELDATQAATGVLHAHLVIPAAPPSLTLAYPKWIPGEHAPTGPLNQIVRLTFSASGKQLTWRRDDLDMYLFHINVPDGSGQVEADLDFACVIGGEGFTSTVCSSQDQLVINWNQVVLYSPALPNDRNPFSAALKLPPGWRYGTALPMDREEGSTIVFKTAPLKTLVDSPLIAGEHYRAVQLGGSRPVEMDLTSESAQGIEIKPEQKAHFSGLVAEAEAIFSGPRYPRYNLLLSLGDSIDHYTLEHFQSSENRLPDHGLLDDRILLTSASLIPHEYVHSWNGKYRPPSGLDTATYQDPVKGELLWVYEGLTDYLGNILAARSGFWTPEQYRQALALDAAQMATHLGRTWRSLQDTTVGVQLLYGAPTAWSSARRSTDFYPESGLMWLEADTIIRQRSGNQRSLDDFCRLFYGPQNGPAPKPYTFADVVAGMNQVQPYDWSSFFRSHLDSTSSQPPLGGITGGGWRLVYTEEKPQLLEFLQKTHKPDLLWPEWENWTFSDLRYSIGLLVGEDGTVLDSVPGMAAYNTGITPGMRVLAVNGQRFTVPVIEEAVRASKSGGKLEFKLANGTFELTRRLAYHEGAKYPRLERDTSRPDILSAIIASRSRSSGER